MSLIFFFKGISHVHEKVTCQPFSGHRLNPSLPQDLFNLGLKIRRMV